MPRSLLCGTTLALGLLSLALLACESDIEVQPEEQWTVVGNPGNTMFAISAGEGVVILSAELHLDGLDSYDCSEGSAPSSLPGLPETVDLLAGSPLAGLIPGSLLEASSAQAAAASEASPAYCSLSLRPTDRAEGNLVLSGEWDGPDRSQAFTARLSLSELSFPLSEGLVIDGQDFIFELAPEGWLSSALLASSLEPGQDIEPGHPLYGVLLAQVSLGAGFYEDLDQNGVVGEQEREGSKLGGPPTDPSPGKAVALGHDPASDLGVGFHSDDGGETWEQASTLLTAGASFPRSVAWGKGRFVAVGAELFMTSLDGEAWGSFAAEETQLNGVTHGGDRWVAVGDGGARLWSEDGVTWNDSSSETGEVWKSVTWDEAFGYVAVGKFGAWACSPDGETWTARETLEFADGNPQSLYSVTSRDGALVAVGDQGARLLHEGPDCSAPWTDLTLESGLPYLAVAASEGEHAYLAVGNELASSSTDGSNWTDTTAPFSLRAVSSTGAGWIAADGGGRIIRSEDPVAWDDVVYEDPTIDFSCVLAIP